MDVFPKLLADPELPDHVPIPIGVGALQVVQQASALADQHQEAAARSVILLVCLEVLGELGNALTQHRDLDLRAPCVRLVCPELLNNVRLTC